MDELRQALTAVAASLQVLAANTTANTKELENMAARSRQNEEVVQALKGTFASIETHLVKLFERDAEAQVWKNSVEARLEAIEKRMLPSAPAA